MLMSTLY